MATTPGWQLGRYLALVQLLARRMRLDPQLQKRFDASDLVQETMLHAAANLGACRAGTEAELVRWLQQILTNVYLDRLAGGKAQKRDVLLERSLHGMLNDSTAWLEALLEDRRQESPSAAAQRRELLARLGEAVEHLEEDQRDVVVLRLLMDAPVAEIAERLGRTEKSVAGLLLRGKRKLRELLADLA